MEHVMERFQRLPLGNICDANGKRGSMDPGHPAGGPQPAHGGARLHGRCHPGDNPGHPQGHYRGAGRQRAGD